MFKIRCKTVCQVVFIAERDEWEGRGVTFVLGKRYVGLRWVTLQFYCFYIVLPYLVEDSGSAGAFAAHFFTLNAKPLAALP